MGKQWKQCQTLFFWAPKSLRMLTAVTAAAKSLQSCLTLCNPVKAHQAPQSLGFYRQEYWSGLPLPSPGDGDCSHEIERRLLLGRKVMANLDSILKSRDITLPTKVPSSQGYGFSSSHVWV